MPSPRPAWRPGRRAGMRYRKPGGRRPYRPPGRTPGRTIHRAADGKTSTLLVLGRWRPGAENATPARAAPDPAGEFSHRAGLAPGRAFRVGRADRARGAAGGSLLNVRQGRFEMRVLLA